MIDFIKWFWVSISFRNWTFEGAKLANPLLIVWRLMLLPVIKITVVFLALLYLIAGNKYSADCIIEDWL